MDASKLWGLEKGAWHNEAWEQVAKIEYQLMTEFLADPDVRPDWQDATWVRDAPLGPKGIDALREVQALYGVPHVTTGNASPGAKGDLLGIYVRSDVALGEGESNFLRRLD